MLKRWNTFNRFLDDGHLPQQQCSGTRPTRRRSGQKGVVVRRRGPWRRACCGHVLAHHHGQAERRGPSRLARRRSPPHRRPSRVTPARTVPLELATSRQGHRRSSLTNHSAARAGCLRLEARSLAYLKLDRLMTGQRHNLPRLCSSNAGQLTYLHMHDCHCPKQSRCGCLSQNCCKSEPGHRRVQISVQSKRRNAAVPGLSCEATTAVDKSPTYAILSAVAPASDLPTAPLHHTPGHDREQLVPCPTVFDPSERPW